MSVPSAELSAPTIGAPSRASAGTIFGRLVGWRLYAALAVLALVVSALSLLIPSTPSYDPWAWIVWGREIVHLDLHTTGGPTWKPLPVIFTTLFAPLGSIAPNLWLIVARAGAVMAVVMVFKLCVRLTVDLGARVKPGQTGLDAAARLAPALLAGLIAAIALALSGGFLSDSALGYSEGLLTVVVLIAFDRHLDGRPRQAFAVGFAAALDRPEIWLLWGPYGLWLWWKDPGARRLVAALFVLIPLLWFLPEYWGSGHLFRGVTRAHNPRSNSPAFAKCPFCTELIHHAWPTVLLRIKVAAALAVGAAAFLLWQVNRSRPRFRLVGARERALAGVIIAGVLGMVWWVVIGIMTQAGFSGNDRYLVLGAALIEVAGGVGWGWAAIALGSRLPRWIGHGSAAAGAGAGTAAQWIAVGGLGLVFLVFPGWVGTSLISIPRTHGTLVYQAHLREDLAAAVRKMGGSAAVLGCGTVMTEGFQVPMVAWTLGVHTATVEAPPSPEQPGPPPNVIFQTRDTRSAPLLPLVRTWPETNYTFVGQFRTFRVFEHCNTSNTRTA
jgi:hypothetical protein